MLLASAKKLRSFGIIGMNQRNFGLISRYNPRHLYPLVDDKLKTKLLAQKAGITVPKLLGTVQYQHDVRLLIHGHTHRAALHAFTLDGEPARRCVLGDWYTQGSVLEWRDDGVELRALARGA